MGDKYLDPIPSGSTVQGVNSTTRVITCDDATAANNATVCGTGKWTAFSELLELLPFMLIISVFVVAGGFALKGGIGSGGTALALTLVSSSITLVIALVLVNVSQGLLVDMVISAYDNNFDNIVAISKLIPTIMVMGLFVISLLVGGAGAYGRTKMRKRGMRRRGRRATAFVGR